MLQSRFTLSLSFFLLFSILGSSSAEEPLKKDNTPSGLTPLTRAIRLEKFDEAKKHITPELVNKMDQGQYHPLTYAAYTSNNELIEALLKAGADPNVVEHNGKTALYVAANMANIEGIKLLHKHGAKRPIKPALSPAVAAVYSSDLGTLKTLLKLYPNIDINRGWEKPDKSDYYRRGSAINHAACFGYEDMAFYLLSKGARATGKDWIRRNALDQASLFPHCSTIFLQKLIDKGLSPIQRFHPRSDGIACSCTPLAKSAAYGYLDKVKVMGAVLDPIADKDAIRRAAHVAAKRNYKDVTSYLLGLLGEKLLPPDEYLAHITPASRGQTENLTTNNKTALPPELNQFMPRTTRSNMPLSQEGTIAIISSDTLRNQSFLLSSALSNHPNVSVLERDSIDKVIHEQSLKSYKNIDSKQLHQNLNLIPARHVIILSQESIKSKKFIHVSLIETSSGLVTSRFAAPSNQFTNNGELKNLSKIILSETSRSGTSKIAISTTPIKSEMESLENVELSNQINTTLPFLISHDSGCASLTRTQLQHLETEKAIGAKGSYWSAGWIIDGGIKNDNKKKVTITLRATNPITLAEFKASNTCPKSSITAALTKTWRELASSLKIKTTPSSHTTQKSETKILTKYAQWLLDAGYPNDATNLLNTCWILGDHSEKVQILRLRSLLSALPSSRFRTNNRKSSHPRDQSIFDILKAAQHINVFHDLCNIGIEYASSIKSKLPEQKNFPSTNKVNNLDAHFNGYISWTLSELYFYRTMMDHAIIYQDHPLTSQLKSLDQKIAHLTRVYIKKPSLTNNHHLFYRQEAFHGLISWDYDYYALFHPELFDEITSIVWSDLSKISSDIEFIIKRFTLSHQRDLNRIGASEQWKKIYNQLLSSGNNHPLIYIPQFKKAKSRIKKLQIVDKHLLRINSSKTQEIHDSQSFFLWPLTEINHMLGVDLIRFEHPSTFQKPPLGGINGHLWQDFDQLQSTHEFYRMHALYCWIGKIINLNYWSYFLDKSLTHNKKVKPSLQLTKSDWKCIYQLYKQKQKNEDKKIISAFKELADLPDDKPLTPIEPLDNTITLQSPIILPSSPTNPSFALKSLPMRATIENDELWIPIIYQKPKTWLVYTDDLLSNPKAYHHAIQVVSLSKKTVQTILMPQDKPKGRGYSTKALIQGPEPIMLGKNFAYFNFRKKKLFCINRSTKEVKEILLPLENIQKLALNFDKELLYVSLRSDDGAKAKSATDNEATLVITIQGSQIVNKLVSNRRKPPESPLDDPDLVVTHIDSTADSVRMIAKSISKTNIYSIVMPKNLRNNTLIKAAIYSPETKQWKKSSDQDRIKLEEQFHQKYYVSPIQAKSFKLHGRNFYLPSSRFNNDPKPHLPVSTTARHTRNIILLHNRIEHQYIKKTPLQLPNIDSPIFNTPTYMVRLGDAEDDGSTERIKPYNFKGWWCTPNQITQKKLFSTHVIGKWKTNYVISLHRREYGLPAIWLVPENSIKTQFAKTLEHTPPPISFNQLAPGPFIKHSFSQLIITSQKGHAEIIEKRISLKQVSDLHKISGGIAEFNRRIHLFGGKRQLTLTPTNPQKQMTLSFNSALINRKKVSTFHVLAKTKDQWEKCYSNEQYEKLRGHYKTHNITLPPNTKDIRIVNEGPKDAGILIDDVLLRNQ